MDRETAQHDCKVYLYLIPIIRAIYTTMIIYSGFLGSMMPHYSYTVLYFCQKIYFLHSTQSISYAEVTFQLDSSYF